jgi:hypothetical protein
VAAEATETRKGPMCGEKRFALKIISGMAAAALLLIFLAVFIQLGLKGAVTCETTRKQTAGPPDELKSLQASEEKALNQYRWMDKEAGRVGIPVERAMALIAKENRAANNE